MRILSQGEPDAPGKPVWVNKTVSCDCGFSAILRESDKKKFKICNETGESGCEVMFVCPTCCRFINLNLRSHIKS